MAVLSRRRVLKYGVIGSAVLAVGGIGLGLQETKLSDQPPDLKALNHREYSILCAIVDRMFPHNPPFISGTAANVPEDVDDLMSRLPQMVVAEFKQALLLLENALTGLIFSATPRPFSQCSPIEQDAILEAWRTSSLSFRRMVFRALNSVCAGAYYANASQFDAIGYPGPPININPGALQ